VKDLVELAQQSRLKASPGMTIQETFEKKVNDALNKVRARVHACVHCVLTFAAGT
jgi:hypothetical protein